ncbi:MAG: shikimate dehydrogenase [Desulfobacterales bacterium]|nr:MAG: shikimate dehydrogenase [Desulfobacterales bacterium]
MDKSIDKADQSKDTGSDITALRRRIDDIDDQILDLINRRLAAAKDIGKIKEQSGTSVVDGRREGQIYRRLSSLNSGPLKTGSLYRIFRSIIGAGRSVQNIQSKIDLPSIYGVFGDPVGHSLSPVMHNSAFAQTGLEGCYLAFQVKDIAAAVSGVRALGMPGVSITIPHKVSVMKYLDQVDAQAGEIGAVNTIVNRQGILYGYNSDCAGAIKALTEKTPINGKAVAVIGAGGGARAVAFGIKKEGGQLTILNRTKESGESLAADLECEFKPLSEVRRLPYDIIINATSAGMTPQVNNTPIDAGLLEGGAVVMDLVYNPLKTRLLNEAKKAGCTTIDGVSMFVHQGAVQFELWTGKGAPVDVMRKVVLEELANH